MNRKRLGQLLIGGVFTLCAAAVTALIELVRQEEARRADPAFGEPAASAEEAPSEP